MSDIPSELYHNILRRVPAESLLRFRAVCKEWRRLIDDPSFIRCHANNQLSSTTLLIRNSDGSHIYSLSLDSINYNNVDAHQVIDVIPVRTLHLTGVPPIPSLPVASCNGLMLLSCCNFEEDWVILNPLTRELHKLPESDVEDGLLIGTGIGYVPASDDYKVVRIGEMILDDISVFLTWVYSMKMKSWKMIGECPLCDFPTPASMGVFLNGALHWRTKDCILALNLETESFHKLPLPPNFRKPYETRLDVLSVFRNKMRLDVLGGCLVTSYYYLFPEMDGWVMKDYGVEKSWTKLFSFEEQANIRVMGSLRPIAYFENKGQVFLQHNCGFFMLDIVKKSAKEVTVHGLPERFSCQIFPGSLIPLDQSYAVEVKSSAGTKASTRSKHSVTITDV